MLINPQAAGAELEPGERSWGSTECILYALGVGAGADELAFTTENSAGITQRALPTLAIVVGTGGGGLREAIGPFQRASVIHAEQAVELHRPVPVEGRVRTTARVAGIYDKGKGALVALEGRSLDAASGQPMFTTRSSLYLRGEGGWGGDRGPSMRGAPPPERPPDHVVSYRTSPDQALLYRLSGDRNPLHSDPASARQAGFDRPILHGLCTYGFTGRALLHCLCQGDPDRFLAMAGRFTSPVLPGDELTVSIWETAPGEALFRTASNVGTVVVDAGRFRFAG